MAARDFDSSDIKKQEELEDITTCIICTEVYTDPRGLPCIHAFCMKCIQETGLKTNKGSGDEMPCPICRTLFQIPAVGFHGLPKNFFIERLIQLSRVPDPLAITKVLCTVCLEDCKEPAGKEIPTADTHCVDCKHNLCEDCCSEHRNFKATRNHKLIPMSESGVDKNELKANEQNVCEFHEQKVLDVYCADCKTVVCAMCFIEKHRNHEGSGVNKYFDGFRKQIQNNTETMIGCIAQVQTKKEELLKAKSEIQERVEGLECDVEKRKDEIKQLIDKHANSLLQSLSSDQQSRLKEIQMSTDDIDAYISNLESYNSYCQRIMAEGSAGDICRAFSDLSLRAFELQQLCQPIIQKGIRQFKLCFRQSELDLLVEQCDNLVGEIEEEDDLKPKKTNNKFLLTEQFNEITLLKQENDDMKAKYESEIKKLKQELEDNKTAMNALQVINDQLKQDVRTNNEKLHATETVELQYKSDPVLVRTIKTKATEENKTDICGLTILDNELFVVGLKSSEVEVYDAINFSFSRRWKLTELVAPRDIGSCNRNKCLYIIDTKGYFFQSTELLKVDPNGKLLHKWSTGSYFGCSLSVTDKSNVILTVNNQIKLCEYSPEGQLILDLNLSLFARIENPTHAIELINGNFLVSNCNLRGQCGMCIVDKNGKPEKSFGRKPDEISQPGYLSVDRHGFVFVVERKSRRVLLLDSDLHLKREILSDERHRLKNPERILLDESNGRLFVADNEPNNQRILSYDFK